MTKRAIIILLAVIMVLTMSACEKNGSAEEVGSTVSAEEQISSVDKSEITSDKSEDFHYADLLPVTNDYFKNGKVTIIDQDGGTKYAFRVTDYQDGEYESYVKACKALGFDDVSYEGENDGGKMFFSYTSDGKYYLTVMLGYQINAIDIKCKESEKNKPTKTN